MGHVVVDVMLKPDLTDAPGQAVVQALASAGFDQFSEVRQGRHFILTVDGEPTRDVLATVRKAAEQVLIDQQTEEVVAVHPVDEHFEYTSHDEDYDLDDDELHGEAGAVIDVSGRQRAARFTGKRAVGQGDAVHEDGWYVGDEDDD